MRKRELKQPQTRTDISDPAITGEIAGLMNGIASCHTMFGYSTVAMFLRLMKKVRGEKLWDKYRAWRQKQDRESELGHSFADFVSATILNEGLRLTTPRNCHKRANPSEHVVTLNKVHAELEHLGRTLPGTNKFSHFADVHFENTDSVAMNSVVGPLLCANCPHSGCKFNMNAKRPRLLHYTKAFSHTAAASNPPTHAA